MGDVAPTSSPLGSRAHTELINLKCPYPLSYLAGPTGCFKYIKVAFYIDSLVITFCLKIGVFPSMSCLAFIRLLI